MLHKNIPSKVNISGKVKQLISKEYVTYAIMEDNNIMVTAVILIGVGIGVSVLGIMKIVEIFKK